MQLILQKPIQKPQLIIAGPVAGLKFPSKGLAEPLMPLKQEHAILSAKEMHKIDKKAAVAAIEDSFKKKLVAGFFGKGDIMEVFYTPEYTAIGVVKDVFGIPYIDKVAIAPGQQGNGLGTTLMGEMIKVYPKSALRAAQSNEKANALYSKFFNWSEPAGSWNVYTRNLSMHEMGPVIEAVSQMPKTLF